MAHTPGPWNVGEDGDVFINGSCIATVCGAADGIEESGANARLIAAAPELLAACKAALRFIGPSVEDEEFEGREGSALARAIAKAEGNQAV